MNVSVFSARLPTPYPHTPSLVLKKIQIVNMLDFPHLFLLFTGKNKYKKCKWQINEIFSVQARASAQNYPGGQKTIFTHFLKFHYFARFEEVC